MNTKSVDSESMDIMGPLYFIEACIFTFSSRRTSQYWKTHAALGLVPTGLLLSHLTDSNGISLLFDRSSIPTLSGRVFPISLPTTEVWYVV